MANVLKSRSTINDKRLALIAKNTEKSIFSNIVKHMTNLLLKKPEIAIAIQNNKENINKTSSFTKAISYPETFNNYKPVVKDTINPLAIEKIQITNLSDFDEMYNKQIKKQTKQLPGELPGEFCTKRYIPQTIEHRGSKVTWKDQVKYNDINFTIYKPKSHIIENTTIHKLEKLGYKINKEIFANSEWWDKYLYQELTYLKEAFFNDINVKINIRKNKDKTPFNIELELTNLVDNVDQHLVLIQLYSFLKCKMPCLLVKHQNNYDINNNKDVVVKNISNAISSLLEYRENLWLFNDLKSKEVVYNNIILVLTFIKVLHNLITINPIHNQTQKKEILCNIAYEICVEFFTDFKSNNVNIDQIGKSMDEIREQRKRELMDKYKTQDDERQLQITLRALGLDTWFDIGDNEKQEQVKDFVDDTNYEIDEADIILQEYRGEDPDSDPDND
jgi:hypothetical protein